MSTAKRPPGVMLYFAETRPLLALMSNEEAGQLFAAILDYAEYDVEPVLGDGSVAIYQGQNRPGNGEKAMTKAEIISAEASGGGMFLVIPSVVMLDESLSLSAKMLYGIITWKSNENSCCWCTNRTFGDVLGISQKRVSALIAGLKEAGHIDVEIIRDDETGQIIRRNIYPVVKSARKISPPIPENEDTPSLKKGISPPENEEEKY